MNIIEAWEKGLELMDEEAEKDADTIKEYTGAAERSMLHCMALGFALGLRMGERANETEH